MMNQTEYYQQEVDISRHAMITLKTVMLLGKAYGGSYINRILTGNSAFDWKKAEHAELETFGELAGTNFSFVDDIIYYLVQQDYLEVTHETFGTIDITDKGRDWMTEASPIKVSIANLKKSWFQVQLMQTLRSIRKRTSENTFQPPHHIFTNFTLNQIIRSMPQTIEEMNQIPGVKEMTESLKLMILAEVTRMWERKEYDEKTGFFRKVYSPSHRKIKELFESGKDLDAIISERELKPDTAVGYLMNLHKAGEINLKPWIEENIAPKDLYKGAEYFKQVSKPLLKEANSILGLDYHILKLCQLFVQEDDEIRLKFAS